MIKTIRLWSSGRVLHVEYPAESFEAFGVEPVWLDADKDFITSYVCDGREYTDPVEAIKSSLKNCSREHFLRIVKFKKEMA